MPSALHEILLQLFRDRPSFVADFVAAKLHLSKLSIDRLEVLSGELAQVSAPQHRADAVLSVIRGDGEKLALVLEVQLALDPEKLFTWPIYLAGIRALLRCPTVLVVVTPDRGVENWARQRITLGPGGDWIRPLVLGPAAIPTVTDPQVARESPELAVLSALAHGKGKFALPVALAAHDAIGQLSREGLVDDEHAKLYADLIQAALGRKARLALEAIMETRYEYKSVYAKKYVAQGKAEGKAEGKADALLAFLSARKLTFSEEQRRAILSCTDLSQLDHWIARAAVASTIEELFGESAK